MALLRRRRVLSVKQEATVGTDASPGVNDAVFNAYDVDIQPAIDYDDREGQGGFGMLTGTLGPYKGTVKFKTDLLGGTSSEPTTFSTLMPACGYVGASHVYGPVSAAPGVSGVKSVTIGVYADGKLKKLKGAMGTAVFNFTAGKRVSIDWTFTGVWVAPIDSALIAPTYPSTAPLRFTSSGFTINSVSLKLSTLTIDLGNQVEMREDSTQASGYISAIITGRKIVGKLDPEASTVATNDVYGQWLAGAAVGALALSMGTAGDEVSIAAPVLQYMNMQEGDRNKIEVDEADFQCVRNAGDDELTFMLA